MDNLETTAAPAPHGGQTVITAGTDINTADAAMILIHGRGATAQGILGLAQALPHEGMIYIAPQAAHHTWYPHSFLAPIPANQPGIDAGLGVIAALLEQLATAGIPTDRTVLAGFSQGACLASEFVARRPRRYGGLLAFSGGVIGPLDEERPSAPDGSLDGTPVFLGCSDRDAHIPLQRVHETAALLEEMGAAVHEKIYPGMGHTIIDDEIEQARQVLAQLTAPTGEI